MYYLLTGKVGTLKKRLGKKPKTITLLFTDFFSEGGLAKPLRKPLSLETFLE